MANSSKPDICNFFQENVLLRSKSALANIDQQWVYNTAFELFDYYILFYLVLFIFVIIVSLTSLWPALLELWAYEYQCTLQTHLTLCMWLIHSDLDVFLCWAITFITYTEWISTSQLNCKRRQIAKSLASVDVKGALALNH